MRLPKKAGAADEKTTD